MKHAKAKRDPKMIKEQMLFCKRIMRIRLQQKRSRIDVAIEANLNPNYYGRIERGKTGATNMCTLEKIRRALDVKWKDIFGPTNPILALLQGTDEDNEQKYYNGS